MTKFEFETRTKVNVTAEEFETINNFYMSCEADKDVFCKMWMQLNPFKVIAARQAAREAAREEANKEFAEKVYFKLGKFPFTDEAGDHLSEREFDKLDALGINPGLRENAYGVYFATCLDVRADLQKKYNFGF